MEKSFDSSFFIGNRKKLLNSIDSDVLIMSANGVLQKSMDTSYPFRQESNFWYLTGLNKPDLILVVTKNEEFLIIPDFFVHRESITSFTHKENFKNDSGVQEVLDDNEGWKNLKEIIKTSSKIATCLPSPELIKFYGIYTNPSKRRLVKKIKSINKNISFEDVRSTLATLRMTKQEVEIAAIQKATDITLDTLSVVLNKENISQYKDTGEIERAIFNGFLKRGGQGHGFDPIVAGGANAALFHFEELGIPIKGNELLYCDVGSSYGMYASDITRTIAIGKPTQRQKDVFEAVKSAQSEARKLIKPGIMLKEYELEVQQIVGKQLKNLGLIKKLDSKSIRTYYPHLCSHSLGIDIHDATNWEAPVPKNMVMTVEPGIYILDEGIGVRIEDIVLVANDGNKLLSGALGSKL